jgi:hypothetical protein
LKNPPALREGQKGRKKSKKEKIREQVSGILLRLFVSIMLLTHFFSPNKRGDEIMPLYSRYASSAYAIQYALSPNPAYPPFPNDCTNFVSQALLAGGWTMIDGYHSNNDVWWYGLSHFSKASYTWAGAHNLSQFLATSGRAKACKESELKLGDVVQCSKDGHVFHSTIVTKAGLCTAEGDGPFLSYHTNNVLNKDLAKFKAAFDSSVTFLYWKILDEFKA